MPGDAVDSVREQLVERERWLLQPGPSTDVGALLSADFGEIGASGRRWDRVSALDLVEGRRGHGVGEYELSEIDCRALGTTTYLLTYAIETLQARARRTSIWEWSDGRWQLVHHQGTRVPEEESDA